MSDKKPTPMVAEHGQVCPVCGKRSYSPAGVHPQCAMKRADDARQKKLAALPPKPPKAPRQRSWNKKCPKCDVQIHVRKKVCPCGYVFPEK